MCRYTRMKSWPRSLSVLDIGEYIPQELYSIVAEILVFVDGMDKIQDKLQGRRS